MAPGVSIQLQAEPTVAVTLQRQNHDFMAHLIYDECQTRTIIN